MKKILVVNLLLVGLVVTIFNINLLAEAFTATALNVPAGCCSITTFDGKCIGGKCLGGAIIPIPNVSHSCTGGVRQSDCTPEHASCSGEEYSDCNGEDKHFHEGEECGSDGYCHIIPNPSDCKYLGSLQCSNAGCTLPQKCGLVVNQGSGDISCTCCKTDSNGKCSNCQQDCPSVGLHCCNDSNQCWSCCSDEHCPPSYSPKLKFCVNHACYECRNDSDCPSGKECYSNLCIQKTPPGGSAF